MDVRTAALAALAQFPVTETTVGEALQRIADITQQAVPAADVVGLSVFDDDGRPATQLCSGPDSPEIDTAQYREDRGPCLEAWRQNTVVRVPRVQDTAEQWPGFVAACLQHDVHSTLTLPVRAGDVALGALTLCSTVEDGFDDGDETLGAELAASGAVVLLNVFAYWSAFDLTAQLNEVLDGRAVIEQAKGMLLAQDGGLTPQDAFAVLVTTAQREELQLREVARRMVGHGTTDAATEYRR